MARATGSRTMTMNLSSWGSDGEGDSLSCAEAPQVVRRVMQYSAGLAAQCWHVTQLGVQCVLGVDKRVGGVIEVALRPVAATSLAGAVLHADRRVADNVVAVDVARIVQTAQRCDGGRARHLEVQRRAAALGGANDEQPRQACGVVAEGPLLRVSGEHLAWEDELNWFGPRG
eukprot:scaffold96069_cov72-Phaeocystis_antarctica.AAC.7